MNYVVISVLHEGSRLLLPHMPGSKALPHMPHQI